MKFFFVFFFLISSLFADEKNLLDPLLRKLLRVNNITPLSFSEKNTNRTEIFLGKKLFNEKLLSGNNRISCSTCHSPKTGTSDARAMSQTENGKGVLRRNAPHLFNIGLKNNSFMFWDGRVHYNEKDNIFTTPEPSLNGVTPKASNITKVLKNALGAQALFPMVNANEMMGKKGENEIANADNNLEAWSRLVTRLMKNKTYNNLFKAAYPDVEVNIGHVARAIEAFEEEEFQSMGSPFERYLRGDNEAMTETQKRGLLVFLDAGKCVRCHNGSELGNNSFFASVAVPQWGEVPFNGDFGRAEITHRSLQNYFFKVPSLFNVALTAPYMHNGIFQTVKEVINHYNHISKSLNHFEASPEQKEKIPVEVEIEKRPNIIDKIWLSSQTPFTPKLDNQLFLTEVEKKYLEIFLKEALTDPLWIK